MLLDLLSQSNYGRYNIKIVQTIGLEPAVYLEELLDINNKAIRKDKITKTSESEDSEIFFTIDRRYIEHRTTITVLRQHRIDEKLIQYGILNKSSENDDEISINLLKLASLVTNPNDLKKHTRSNALKEEKQKAVSKKLKSTILATNVELRDAYYSWIDSISTSNVLSCSAVKVFEKEVDNFSDHYLDVALEIINIATVNAWKDPYWSINAYKKRHNISGDKVVFTTKF